MAKRILAKLINIEDDDTYGEEDDSDEDERERRDEAEDELQREEELQDYEDRRSVQSRRPEKKEEPQRKRVQHEPQRSQMNFALTFKDVEESIKKFSGEEAYPVESWIDDIEDMAELMGWTDLQKLVFAKKSMTGLARLFIQGEKRLRTFCEFRAAMLREFGKKVNTAQLHRLLATRRMKKEESVREYFLRMKEIAVQGNIENDALMQYVIDGIPDSVANKAVLYGAQNFQEFKSKMEVYQKIYDKQNRSRENPENRGNDRGNPDKTKTLTAKEGLRCFSCGEVGHRAAKCNRKAEGVKCFACNEFAHLSTNCPNKKQEHPKMTGSKKPEENTDRKSVRAVVGQPYTTHEMRKMLRVNGFLMNALIDTGSDLNLMRLEDFLNIGAPQFVRKIINLGGFGKSSVNTLGRFDASLDIDDVLFTTEIFVVPDDAMDMPLIVGKPVLDKVTVTVNTKTLKIEKTEEVYPERLTVINDDDEVTDETGNNVNDDCYQQSEIHQIRLDARDEIDIGLPGERDRVWQMIEGYQPTTKKTTNVRLKLVLRDDQPIASRPRPLPRPEQAEVDDQIDRWLKQGIIRESTSEYSSPIVIVRKKSGEMRICVDFRKLNAKIVRDRYPIPVVEDQLDKLTNAKIFSTLDLKDGFFHVPLDEGSIRYTSFVTQSGQYEFLKTPFGICNSPAIFQRYICNVFRDFIRDGTLLTYMDDIIIPAGNKEEAIDRLTRVLKRAEEYDLQINWRKCHFLCTRIEYLGHIVENNLIRPSPTKIEAVLKFPQPRSVKEVQSFLGLTGYFRKFIRDYALIARPLSDMLKKDRAFKFAEEERTSFELLKKKLTDEPVLKIFNYNKETQLHTDASKEGYGAILLQKDDEDGKFHPVHYMSRKRKDAEKNYSSYELEVLAVIEAVKKFRVYLLGTKFKLVTDCSALTMTLKKKDLTTRVARWALLLEEFQYEVEHRAGVRMQHCDALSRCPIAMHIGNAFLETMRSAQQKDEQLSTMMKLLKTQPHDHFVEKMGLLYKEKDGIDLLVIPTEMQEDVIRRHHENGHFAVKKVKDLIEKEFWIPSLAEKIQKVISNCIPCIISERKAGKQEGWLNPIPKGDSPLDTLHIDHLGPMTATSKKYKYVLVVIDAFSKFVWIYPTKTTNAEEVIQKLEELRSIFGNPYSIIADKGSAFTSNAMKEYCDRQHIKLSHITTGIPRGNGQVERTNRSIIPILQKLAAEKPDQWYKHVRKVQEALNSTVHRSIAATPFEILVGVPMRREEEVRLKNVIEEEYLNRFLETRCELREKAKEQISRVQEENRRTYNKKRKKAHDYDVGDLVAIKRTQFAACDKLMPKFLGPYKISRKIARDRYEVRKVGNQMGPRKTETSADYMKPWSSSFGANEVMDGRVVGLVAEPTSNTKRWMQCESQSDGGKRTWRLLMTILTVEFFCRIKDERRRKRGATTTGAV